VDSCSDDIMATMSEAEIAALAAIIENSLEEAQSQVASSPENEEEGWSCLDTIHLGLDGAGLIPYIGFIADGANTLLYLAEGKRTEACISAIAMIPIVGTGATTAKLSKNALKATDTIADIATDGRKVADAVADSADLARDANKVRKSLWVRKVVNGRIVYQRDDLFEWTSDNINLMRDGRAPIGYDGKPIQLHHLLQMEPGSLAEVTTTFHKKIPNKQVESGNSYQKNPKLKQAYKNYRENYWKTRVLDNPNQ